MVEEVGNDGGPDIVDWTAVEADYRGGVMPVKAICATHGITPAQLYYRRQKFHWPSRHNVRMADADLIRRMLRLVDHQISQLERMQMTAGDKEVALLGNLTRTLEKLMELKDRRTEPPAEKREDSAEIKRMRAALVKRMREIQHH